MNKVVNAKLSQHNKINERQEKHQTIKLKNAFYDFNTESSDEENINKQLNEAQKNQIQQEQTYKSKYQRIAKRIFCKENNEDRQFVKNILLNLSNQKLVQIQEELIYRYKRNLPMSSQIGKCLTFTTLYLYLYCQDQIRYQFIENQKGLIQIIFSEQQQNINKSFFKKWFQWVIQQHDQLEIIFKDLPIIQGMIMTRQIGSLVDYLIKKKRWLQAQFCSRIEDPYYRSKYFPQWNNLPSILLKIGKEEIAFLPQINWVIDYALCCWYNQNSEINQSTTLIANKYCSSTFMVAELGLIVNKKDVQMQINYQELSIADLCFMLFRDRMSKDLHLYDIYQIFKSLILKNCDVNIFWELLTAIQGIKIVNKPIQIAVQEEIKYRKQYFIKQQKGKLHYSQRYELITLFIDSSQQNANNFLQLCLQKEAIKNSDYLLYQYIRFAYQFKNLKKQFKELKNIKSIIQSLTKINYQYIKKLSHEYKSIFIQHIIQVINTFKICCGYNIQTNNELLQCMQYIDKEIVQKQKQQNLQLKIKVHGLKSFLLIKLQIQKVTLEPNIENIYLFLKDNNKQQLSRQYKFHVRAVVTQFLLQENDEVYLDLKFIFDRIPKCLQNKERILTSIILTGAKKNKMRSEYEVNNYNIDQQSEDQTEEYVIEEIRTICKGFFQSPIYMLFEIVKWNKKIIKQLILAFL